MPSLERLTQRRGAHDPLGDGKGEELVEHLLQCVVANVEHRQRSRGGGRELLANVACCLTRERQAASEQQIERHPNRPTVVSRRNTSACMPLRRVIGRHDARLTNIREHPTGLETARLGQHTRSRDPAMRDTELVKLFHTLGQTNRPTYRIELVERPIALDPDC